MTSSAVRSTLASLPDAYKALLYVLFLATPRNKTSLLEQLKRLGVRATASRAMDGVVLGEMLETLQRLNWLERGDERSFFRLNPAACNQVLLLLQSEPQWWPKLRAGLIEHAAGPGTLPVSLWRGLWLALLAGEVPELTQLLLGMEQDRGELPHPCGQLLADETGRQLFARLVPGVREVLLEDYLTRANGGPLAAGEAYRQGLALLDSGQAKSAELPLQLFLQALWRGDWPRLEALGQGEQAPFGRVFRSLLRGESAQALEHLQEFIRLQRGSRKRRVELPAILNACYCLLLLLDGDSQQHAALRQALGLGLKKGLGSVYEAFEKLFEQFQGKGSRCADPAGWVQSLNGFDGLLTAIALYWVDAPASSAWQRRLQKFRAELAGEGYEWLVAELDALLERQFGLPPTDWHRRQGLRPLVERYRRQELWEHALAALAALRPGSRAVAPVAPQSSQRLAWMIGSAAAQMPSVEPREQKLGAKGQWSKGRAVALKRLLEETDSFDYLLEQDRRVIQQIQMHSDYYGVRYQLDGERALPHLVGHPALFWSDAPEVRIDLVAGSVALELRQRGSQIHLALTPEGIAACDGLFLERETPTRLVVYPLGREAQQIAAILGGGLSVPQSAKAQLMETIGSIAPLLPIHSDLPELAVNIDKVAADGKLYAHLLPLLEGLRLQLLVRPLAGGSWFRPGQGAESVLGEQDGRPLQAVRDLPAERQGLKQVLQACPALAEADSDGHEWQLAEPQAALQVLSELQGLDAGLLECVWPEGERMRIKAQPGLRQLQLRLRQSGDWFELEGEVVVDDGRVLQLRQLLELLQASPGRFVRLGEQDWLALGASLRRRLEELGRLAERNGDEGLRLNSLTAPLLAELAEEVGSFEADAAWKDHLARLESLRDYRPRVPSTLQAELRDYQLEGFDWMARLAKWGVGACLADDMGLGKTLQTLTLLLHRSAAGPQLVVAPTSVTPNWLAETTRFAPTLRLHAYRESRSLEGLGPRDLVVASYGLLQLDAEAFAGQNWTTVVLDEAQAIKNAASKRSQAAMALQADFRLVATGTPLENHLGELWNLFRFINPGLLGSREHFAQRFAGPIERGDQVARKALKALIQPFILRRLKSQVLDELPARTEVVYRVPLSDAELHHYEAMRQQALDSLSQAGEEGSQSLRVLTEITRLRRFCCHPSLVLPDSGLPGSKLAAFAEIVEELLDSRHKALVFSQFVDHLSIVRGWLEERGIRYQYLDGSTPAKDRMARVEAFQGGDGDIFLISLRAGGTGLNLTAADYVIHLDPWWNPAVEDQASDRAHRMGQQRPVTIYRLVAENTIEERILALHGQKRDLADSLLEGGEVSAKLDAEALLRLLRGG
ncbi:Superfamily II DNA or RNA helicase, SNF2 family [Azotobacter beijerinckii]|uniref:Superfamily II DNA or RNA helicase, SNF2 family n=1 Tax=Azotobacter beijerinckii TaxID=170623 RepID=A0A1H6V2D5_9GAMM|nr:DEAD/DEAH box helicase [Azotobacter beijerinckii]SEI98066.1 Superfamily II DNA or RNA helicase, SNF2 family [Azotobacter beijerinckii]